MATFATFWKKNYSVTMANGVESPARPLNDPFALRALPGDDVYFFCKRIDNSRVVRQTDPASRGECWSMVGAATVLLALGASIIAPHVASVRAGYELEDMKQRKTALSNELRDLDVREAVLLSPERLHDLAAQRNMTSPGADQIFHLDGQNGPGTVASNETPAVPASGR